MAATPLLDDSVFHSRAVCSAGVALENDPEPMVQQQFARLRFFEQHVGARGLRVLDYGCGTGFNCGWLCRQAGAGDVLGFDLSAGAVELARRACPDVPFRVADGCDPGLDLGRGTWDRVLSCEVLEHVPDMPAFLANVRAHLKSDGVAFVTTPNRPVFSLGHEPSPVNREHIKELTHGEFLDLLRPRFSSVEIHGQRFRDPALLAAWQQDVRQKIRLCEAGTRWQTRPTLRAQMRRWRMASWAYEVPLLRAAWKAVRWDAPAALPVVGLRVQRPPRRCPVVLRRRAAVGGRHGTARASCQAALCSSPSRR
jgi:SAM-dependent methyltransferase